MSETYFITGATGFIGYRLASRLVGSGNRVKCLARANSRRETLKKLGVELVDGSLSDVESLRRGIGESGRVMHLAGLTRELRSGDFMKVNCEGTRNVARVCAELGGRKLVVTSSLAGAGMASKTSKAVEGEEAYAPYRLRRETDVPRPISPYGKSKYAAEKALLDYADQTEIAVVRPPYVFGEGDLLSLELFKMVKKNGTIVVPGYFNYYYSFVHVDDLIEIMLAALERGERLTKTSLTPSADDPNRCSGVGVYFPTCPKPIRFSEYGASIGRGFGRSKVKTLNVPPLAVLGAGVYGEIIKSLRRKYAALDWNKAIEAVRGPWICSGEKVVKELSVAVDPSLDEKIARAAAWYEQQGLL